MLAAADPVGAEFMPLYVRGEAAGHSRAEMRGWPVPYAAVMLGVVGEGAEPVLKGSRAVVLGSDRDEVDSAPAPRSRTSRPRRKRETGRVYRGSEAR